MNAEFSWRRSKGVRFFLLEGKRRQWPDVCVRRDKSTRGATLAIFTFMRSAEESARNNARRNASC
jgi:hypothetical protein